MLFLDSHNLFQEQMSRRVRGEAITLDPGYDELFAKWEEVNKETLYRLSAEERTKSFVRFVDDYAKDELLKLVNAQATDAETKRKLQEMANRGELILISKDGGKTFDSYVTPEDAKQANPLEITMLSSSLRSSTTNFKEVCEEQELVHALGKLEDQGFLVNQAWIEAGALHIEAVHPKNGQYEVEIDLNQPSELPLTYTFINAAGKTAVPETQLPEAYGVAVSEIGKQVDMESAALSAVVDANTSNVDDDLNKKMAAGIGGLLMAAKLGQPQKLSAQQRAEEAAALARGSMERPLLFDSTSLNKTALHLPNVAASKAAMNARMARQKKSFDDSQIREKARIELSRKEEARTAEDRKAQTSAQKNKSKQNRKRLITGSALGAGAAGGMLGVLGGSGWFVSHVNLFS